jgi:cation diffusion facilitator CzcD-associated flavoprotein CzcO
MQDQPLDVLIIGAGVSGIAVARALQQHCPRKHFAIVERRQQLGGTWDLFRYPGARSDSDMLSYAYESRPWPSTRVLAGAGAIRDYLGDTVREAGLDRAIHYGQRVRSAHWSAAEQLWTVRTEPEGGGQPAVWRCRFLVFGTGYYNHDQGHRPQWPGLDAFTGTVLHPQHWPEGTDTRGRRVVVIGSGATAVSLVPALADGGARVTLLQRSPTWLMSLPSEDRVAGLLGHVLPQRWALAIARRANIGGAALVYRLARRWPKPMGRWLRHQAAAQLQGAGDLRDFTPRYDPWQQRLCIVADGDLFRCVREGKAEIVTDEIEAFDASGVQLRSGRRLEADVVVTATGLRLQALGGIDLRVDGAPWRAGEHMLYRGVLPEGLPNAAWILGYANASWTLKAELCAAYLCRLLAHLDDRQLGVVVARDHAGCRTADNVMSVLDAGYVRRGDAEIPRQGDRAPWHVAHDLRADRQQLLRDPVDDGWLRFEPGQPRRHPTAPAAGGFDASLAAAPRTAQRCS